MQRTMLSLAAVAAVASASAVHPERAQQIKQIQAAKPLWNASAVSRFASQAPGASKKLCGVNGDWADHLVSKVNAGDIERFNGTDADPIGPPETFDSEKNWPACAKSINDIRDQSMCGCCWAFGGAEAASDRMCIATKGKMLVPLSAQDVCFCSNPNGCGGGQISTPWEWIASSGAVSGGQYKGSGPFGSMCSDFSLPHCHHHGPQGNDPYPAEGTPGCPSQSSPQCPSACGAGFPGSFASDKYTFTGGIQMAQGEAAIQQMIMAGGPVETAFTVYSDFENYAGGIYHHVSGGMAGGHAVKFVGWGVDGGVKYWKVANSWNPYWGENGYFRIVRGTNECNIEGGVTGSHANAVWSKAG